MNRFPIAQTLVFAALAVADIVLAVAAPTLVASTDAPSVTAIGGAMFGGSLAFYLSEMFHWERARSAA
jgi:hypothetical protein